MSEQEFEIFKKKISGLIGLDLLNYKNPQLQRRITFLMNKHNIFNYNEYFNVLNSNKERYDEFLNMLTINVTEFFRNEDKFSELQEKFIPDLVKKHGKNLKIWSAGCSCGAEIYSIAIILDKMKILDNCNLIASDFDNTILEKAKNATYSKYEINEKILEKYKEYFIINNEKGIFQLNTKISSKVNFKKQDLLKGPFEKNFHLILCRNVVIYFTEEAKDKLYQDFYNSLADGGILFIGTTERINLYKTIGYNLISSFFYQR